MTPDMPSSSSCRRARTSAICAICAICAILLLILAACSPVFNWREVPLQGGELVVLLPCKPDRAERQMPLGDQSVRVDMAGCETGGATFAVAHANAADAAQAQAWMNAWRMQAYAQWAGARVEESPAGVVRAALAPAPLRLDASLPPADRSAPARQASLLWFAHRNRDGTVALYQATVLGKPSSPEAVENFFSGLRLPG